MLPNVICPGVQKAGTTYLYSLLRQHPQIFMSMQKEIHFFSQPKVRKKGVAYYEKFFRNYNNEKVIMEVTPRYITTESFIIDIKAVLGEDTKFVIMLRDPVKRLISQYRMRKSKKRETLSLNEVIKRDLLEISDTYVNHVKRGFYFEQIKILEKHFSKEQIHLIVLEEFMKNTQNELKKLMKFLKIDENFIFNTEKNKNTGKGIFINRLGKVYYYFPLRYRRKILNHLPEDFETRYVRFLFNKKNELPNEPIREDLKKQLCDLYYQQNDLLSKEYHLSLDEWKSCL